VWRCEPRSSSTSQRPADQELVIKESCFRHRACLVVHILRLYIRCIVVEESHGAPILDLLVRAIKVKRARGERALPVSGARTVSEDEASPVSETGDVEFKQDRIEVVSGDGAESVVEDRANGVSQLESLGFHWNLLSQTRWLIIMKR